MAGGGTFGATMASAARQWPEHLWLVDEYGTSTFGELERRAREVARALTAAGVERGDAVAIFLPNRAEWFVAELGAALIGAPVVPLNTRFKVAELDHVLRTSAAKAVVWTGTLRGRDAIEPLVALVPEVVGHDAAVPLSPARLPSVRLVVGVGDGEWPAGVRRWDDFVATGASVSDAELDALAGKVTPDDVALVVFTSGTTGVPKGAMLSHGGLVDHMTVWARHLGFRPGDRAILASPIFWGFGCALNALVPLIAGSSVVLHDVFDAGAWLADIDRWECTYLQGVPTQYQMLLDHPDTDRHDLSRIRLVQIGGAPSAHTLMRRLLERAPKAVPVSSFGLTEGGFVDTATALGDDLDTVLGTVGPPLPDTEASIRVPGGDDEVPAGEVGELCLRGRHLMTGYLGDPEQTAAALRDGWLRTGDLATADERGYLRIVGRHKDMYITGGMNVYPPEVENVLASHPGVAQVAVIGVPDARMGEIGVAWVVPRADAPSGDDVVAFARERLADYKVPRVVRFVDDLPLSASGKVTKFVLAEQWAADGLSSQ